LGSTTCVTDAEAENEQEFSYLPCGALRVAVAMGTSDEKYKYARNEQDSESGLYYFGARYVACHLNNFISTDPAFENVNSTEDIAKLLRDPSNLNPYSYAKRNPQNYVDSSGRHAIWVHEKLTRESINLGNTFTPSGGYGKILFSQDAINRVVKGNVFTDTFQGASAEEARMHGMRGQVKDADGSVRFQTLQEAQTATAGFIQEKIHEAVEKAKAGKTGEALEAFGMATHTVQDRLQHNFEEWHGTGGQIKSPKHSLLWHGIKDVTGGPGEAIRNKAATMEVRDEFIRELQKAGGERLVKSVLEFKEPR
jgi:RHS repeat-associated protein